MIANSTNMPTSSVAAVFSGVGQPLDLRSIALPAPAAGEAIVRIECCTICGSDLHSVTGARSVAVPSILGHEAVGTIVAVGDPAPETLACRPVAIGDRVTWSVSVSCGECDRCQHGLPQKCRELSKYGHEKAEGRDALNGGLAEYLLLRRGSSIVSIAPDIPNEVICPANCATATVAATVRHAGDVARRRTLIFGAGMLGLTAAAMLRTRGAAKVVVCDPNPKRLALAREFGATTVIPWTDDLNDFRSQVEAATSTSEFDAIFEFSGAAAAVERAYEVAAIGARLVLAGTVMPSRPVSFDPEQLVRRCLVITGVHNYAPVDLQTAVEFLAANHRRFPFASIVSRSYSLADINMAIEHAIEHKPIRVAIRSTHATEHASDE